MVQIKIREQEKEITRTFNPRQHEETNVYQQTDIGQAITEINKDEIEEGNFSGMDMRSNLHAVEVPDILALDSLVALGFLPTVSLNLTRSKKRLQVSIDGKGRSDIIKIIGGDTMRQEKKSGLGRMFGGQQ